MLMSLYSKRSMTALKRVCTEVECMTKAAMKTIETKKAKQRKEWKQRKENLKIDIGVKKKQSQEPLQKSINRIAVLIDKDKPCIARPIENHVHFDGGHVYSVGSHPALRYNLHNVFKQSVKSNRDLGGEQSLMLEGIEIIHGPEQRKKTESLIQKYPVLKLTYDEKKDALKEANKIIRELEKGVKHSRDQVNELIGIYK